MANKLIYVLLLAIVPVTAFAQSDTIRKKVVVYNQDYFGGYETVNNVIKVNPLLIFAGDIPIYYERKLSNNFSVEGALGITTRNYLRDLWVFTTEEIYNKADSYRYSHISNKLGFSLRLAGKFFPVNDVPAPHEFYFGPAFEFRRYNYSVPQVIDDPMQGVILSPTQEATGSTTFTDMKIMFGYSDFFEKNIMVEYYGGVGLRIRNQDLFDIREVVQPGGGNIAQTVIVNEKKAVPILSAGVKLGFGWK